MIHLIPLSDSKKPLPCEIDPIDLHKCKTIEYNGEQVCRLCGKVQGSIVVNDTILTEESTSGFHTLKMSNSDLKSILKNPYSAKIFERQTRSPLFALYVPFELTCHKLRLPKFLIVEAISTYAKILSQLKNFKSKDDPKRVPAYQIAIFCIYKTCKNYSIAITLDAIFEKIVMTYSRKPDQNPKQILNKISKIVSTMDLMKLFIPKSKTIHCLYYFNIYMIKTGTLLHKNNINLQKFKRVAYRYMMNIAESSPSNSPHSIAKNAINHTLVTFNIQCKI